MEIVENNWSSKEDMLNTFKNAKAGDVIATVDYKGEHGVLMLGIRNRSGNAPKTMVFYNPNSGYVWRDGGQTHEEIFDKFFVGANDQVKIKELRVYKNSTLVLK